MPSRFERSSRLMELSRERIPGGVNSPVRAYRAVGGTPPFIRRAAGPHIWDEDDQQYVDFVGSWGPMILGHAHPEVLEALAGTMKDGTSFGAPTEREYRLAERIHHFFPSMEKVRLVSSGTEATMSAVRLARGFTRRELVLKFDGCYHGHSDGFLVQAGSGATTLGQPDSPGVPAAIAATTLRARYNDLESAREAASTDSENLAAVIVEAVAGNMGVIPPREGFLAGLRDLCDQLGALLIFDEVITGFRVAPGGAQARFGIKPDLTTLGKIVGGGLPLGVFGGRAEVMNQLAPDGPVYQAGTLSGNPLAVAAGLATLEVIERQPGMYDELELQTSRLVERLGGAAKQAAIPLCYQRVGSMFTGFFTDRDGVGDYDEARECDAELFRRYFRLMLEQGIYLAPSPFEASFVSTAHGPEELEQMVRAHERTLDRLTSDS